MLVELKRQGLIRHIGLSNVSATQLAQAQPLTDIVCVQNLYNLAQRDDDLFIDDLARQRISRAVLSTGWIQSRCNQWRLMAWPSR